MDGEAIVLFQAIHSIKEIIRKDPSSHEKVISWRTFPFVLILYSTF